MQNSFPYSDTNKRYHTYDYYLKKRFGGKVAKIVLDIGLSCPNIDGRCGTGGCIYCSARGSGDFAPSHTLSVSEQYRIGREKMASKWSVERCIAYFQAHTNTYAPLSFLLPRFEEALAQEGVVGINIATRADCLEEDVVAYLAALAERTELTVELGLQSSDDETAKRINRGHDFAAFCQGVARLRAASDRIGIGVHLIFGLPGEGREQMLRTVDDVVALHPDQIKIHLLHVLRGTVMEQLWRAGAYEPLTQEAYVELVADALERIPPEVVIARLTGDGMGDALLAPLWSRRKVCVLNDIDKLLAARESCQGRIFLHKSDFFNK